MEKVGSRVVLGYVPLMIHKSLDENSIWPEKAGESTDLYAFSNFHIIGSPSY